MAARASWLACEHSVAGNLAVADASLRQLSISSIRILVAGMAESGPNVSRYIGLAVTKRNFEILLQVFKRVPVDLFSAVVDQYL